MAIALAGNAHKDTLSGGYNETSIANSKLKTVSTTKQAYITQASLRLSEAKAGLELLTLLLLPPGAGRTGKHQIISYYEKREIHLGYFHNK